MALQLKRLFKWAIMLVSLLSLFQDHQYILPPLHPSPSKVVLILYYKEGCPYAIEVHSFMMDWIAQQSTLELTTRQSTPQFPSPTLRIPVEDFYVNHIGVKSIKEAIKTTIFN
jgi:hypothetical protein